MTAIDVIQQLQILFDDRGRWYCRGGWAATAEGVEVEPDNPRAVCFCLVGAVIHITQSSTQLASQVCRRLWWALPAVYRRGTSVCSALEEWNDGVASFTDLHALLRDALHAA